MLIRLIPIEMICFLVRRLSEPISFFRRGNGDSVPARAEPRTQLSRNRVASRTNMFGN
jgi:hypothetical protein